MNASEPIEPLPVPKAEPSADHTPVVRLIVPSRLASAAQQAVGVRVVLGCFDVVRAGAGADRHPGAGVLVDREQQVVAAVAAAGVGHDVANRRVAGERQRRCDDDDGD